MASKLETDFNTPPYYNTHDADNDYRRVLFKPGVALQSRELLELQDILQDQVSTHADHIFKEGSVVRGCSFSLNFKTIYMKFEDLNAAGLEFNVSRVTANGTVAFNPVTGVRGAVVDGVEGLESQNPDLKTVYVKYVNGSAKPTSTTTTFNPEDTIHFINGEANSFTLTMSDTSSVSALTSGIVVRQKISGATGTVTVGNSTHITVSGIDGYFANGYALQFSNVDSTSTVNVSSYSISNSYLLEVVDIASNTTYGEAGNGDKNTVGYCSRAFVTDGYVYQKGHFVRVAEQSVVAEKYSTLIKDSHVGFYTKESIVNSSADATLLDSASGFSNENAPGADRLQLTPTLVSLNSTAAAANSQFVPLAVYSNGYQQQYFGETRYSFLNDSLARRTYDESGNYVVDDFIMSTESYSSNDAVLADNFNIVTIGPGTAYVKGYRFQTFDNRYGFVRKGNDTANLNNQSVFTNYDYAIHVDEAMGFFNFKTGDLINLHDTDPNFLSSDTNYNDGISTATISGNIIGTARIRSIERQEGVLGTPTGQLRVYLFSIVMNEGSPLSDVLAISQGSSGSYNAVASIIKDSSGNTLRGSSLDGLLFKTGLKGVKTITDASVVVRTADTMAISGTQGSLSISNSDIFPYGTGDPTPLRNEFMVVPRSSFRTGSLTGTIAATSGNSTIVGTTTSFIGELAVGQYIHVAGADEIVRVDQINSDTSIEVDPAPSSTVSGQTARYAFPADVPIDLEQQSGVVGVSIGSNANTVTFTFDSSANVGVTADVAFNKKVTNATHRSKTFPSGGDNTSWVYLDITAAADKNGPWCLSVADVFSIEKVYGSSSGTSISGATDITSSFELDNGQRRDVYSLAWLYKKQSTTIDLSSYDYLVVQLKYFTHGTGDYFSVDSYPTSNTIPLPSDRISVQQIPIFYNTFAGEFNLRNLIDFRPVADNNITPGATVGAAVQAGNSEFTFDSSDLKFPAPNERVDYDVDYYLPRKDIVIVGASGRMSIVEGEPSLEPVYPKPISDALTLAQIDIPVFPSLDARTAQTDQRLDLMMNITNIQPRNYTMEDIGKLDNRLKALEYESSLNTLERRSRGEFLPSEVDPTVERFKTSINVDEFDTLLLTDLNSPETKIVPGRPRRSAVSPPTTNDPITLVVNAAASGNVSLNNVITRNYTHTEWISQPYADYSRRCLQDEYESAGSVTCYPSYDNYYDSKSNALNQGTTGIDIPPQFKLLIGTSDRADYLNESVQEYTTITGDDVNTKANRVAVGDFTRDMRITPYMRSREIMLLAVGLVPGKYHRVYMGETDITQYCVPVTMEGADTGNYLNPTTKNTYLTNTWNKNPNKFFGRGTRGTYQSALEFASGSVRPAGFKADVDGNILVNYKIPNGTFLVGNWRISFADSPTYDFIDEYDSTAFGSYDAYNYAVIKGTYVAPKPAAQRKASVNDSGGGGDGHDGKRENWDSSKVSPVYGGGTYYDVETGREERNVVTSTGGRTVTNTGEGGGTKKIICSALYRLGHMPYAVFEADQLYGRKLREEMPEINDGYRKWAQVVVDWMDGKGPSFMPWIQDDQVRAQKQSDLTIKVTKVIATPWAIQMAHEMGVLEKGSFTGKLLMTLGYPISKLVHKTKRKATQFDYYLLAGFCMALYGISNILKPLEGIKDFDDLSEEDLMNAERKLRSL